MSMALREAPVNKSSTVLPEFVAPFFSAINYTVYGEPLARGGSNKEEDQAFAPFRMSGIFQLFNFRRQSARKAHLGASAKLISYAAFAWNKYATTLTRLEPPLASRHSARHHMTVGVGGAPR